MDPLQLQTQAAFNLLKSAFRYTQAKVLRKMETLGYKVSATSFNHIINGHSVGDDSLITSSKGILELVAKELGYIWENGALVERKSQGWIKEIVGTGTYANTPKSGFKLYDKGRLSIPEKVSFFSTAEKEIIEFGITLNTFSSYFFNRNEYEFKIPVKALLNRGIDYSCYLLDPNSNEALMYFKDRAKIIHEENKGIEKIKNSLEKLLSVKKELEEEPLKGKFEIYTYKHIPCNSFLIVDGGMPMGKMIVSHYIYGQYRANCPSLEIYSNKNHSLFRRYYRSFEDLTKEAKEQRVERL